MMVRVLAAMIARRMRRVGIGVRIVGEIEAAGRLARVLASPSVPRVAVFYWNSDALALSVVVGRRESALQRAGSSVEILCDDSLGGRVSRELLGLLGVASRGLRWANEGERAQDLRAVFRSSTSFGLAVDGHGPYHQVGAAFPRLVHRCGAVAVPLAVVAGATWRIPGRAPLVMPKSGATISVELGEPIAPSELSAAAGLARLQDGLRMARHRAGDRLASVLKESIPSGRQQREQV